MSKRNETDNYIIPNPDFVNQVRKNGGKKMSRDEKTVNLQPGYMIIIPKQFHTLCGDYVTVHKEDFIE